MDKRILNFRKNWGYFLIGIFVLAILGFFGRDSFTGRWRVQAITNIHSTSTDHWAWNDIIGWMDFYSPDKVMVGAKGLDGYASSSLGEISLNCGLNGNASGMTTICSTSDYKVINNGAGNLSGWAWNDAVGWISFCGTTNTPNSNCPSTAYFYNINVVPITSDQPPSNFWGWAWNDVVGWFVFDCVVIGSYFCDIVDFRTRTDWFATSTYGDLESSIFDTGVVGGVQFNSISVIGKNINVNGTGVYLQFATECLGVEGVGPLPPPGCENNSWKFVGPDNTSSTFYKVERDVDNKVFYTNLERRHHYNARYFRYRLRLKSNGIQDTTPVVDDVIVNFSP